MDIDREFAAITDAALGHEADMVLDKTLKRVKTWMNMMREEGQDPTLGSLIRKCLAEENGRGQVMAVMCAAMVRLIEQESE